MGEHDLKKTLFQHEVKVLENAKKRLADSEHLNETDLRAYYMDIVKNYEKLLKMTMKTYKISDIQGKMVKEQQSEITRFNHNLRKVEESRKRFISDISHEMGAPIRAILSFLKIIVDGKAELEPKYIQLIYERILSVNDLIKDLFDLSILEVNGTTFTLEKVSVIGLMEKLCSKYEIDVKTKGIQFVYKEICEPFADSRLFIDLDFSRMEQVMTNLINNAIKFTPTGGTITITPEITDVLSAQPKLLIKIHDTGSGIGEENVPFIFDRFYKGNQQVNELGTGLGLAISKEIVAKHNGTIQVVSKENEGSTFIIALPTYLQNEETANEAR